MLVVGVAERRQICQVNASGHVGKPFTSIIGIDGMQHAVIGAYVDGFFARIIDRRGIDDVAEQAAAIAQRTAGVRLLLAPVADDVGRVLRTRHRRRGGARQRRHLIRRGERRTVGAVMGEHLPVRGRDSRGGAPQGGAGINARARHREGAQIANPLARDVMGQERARVGVHAAGARGQVGERTGAFQDGGQRTSHGGGELGRIIGQHELATPVHRGMPQVVDVFGVVIAGIGPELGAGGDCGQIGLGVQRAGRADGNGEGNHVLPERRVGAAGTHVVDQIRTQIVLPVAHRHIAQVVAVGAAVGVPRAVGIGLAGQLTGNGSAGGVVLLAYRIGVAGLVGIAIGGQQSEVLPATELVDAFLRPPGTRFGATLEILSRPVQRIAQGRVATARGTIQALVPLGAIVVGAVVHEQTTVAADQQRVVLGDDVAAQGSPMDGAQAHAQVAAHITEGLTHTGLGHLHAGAVVGVPGSIVGALVGFGTGARQGVRTASPVGASCIATPTRLTSRTGSVLATHDPSVRVDLVTVVIRPIVQVTGRIDGHVESARCPLQVDAAGSGISIVIGIAVTGTAGHPGTVTGGAHPRLVGDGRVVMNGVARICLAPPVIRYAIGHVGVSHRTGVVQHEQDIGRDTSTHLYRLGRYGDAGVGGQRDQRGQEGEGHGLQLLRQAGNHAVRGMDGIHIFIQCHANHGAMKFDCSNTLARPSASLRAVMR